MIQLIYLPRNTVIRRDLIRPDEKLQGEGEYKCEKQNNRKLEGTWRVQNFCQGNQSISLQILAAPGRSLVQPRASGFRLFDGPQDQVQNDTSFQSHGQCVLWAGPHSGAIPYIHEYE